MRAWQNQFVQFGVRERILARNLPHPTSWHRQAQTSALELVTASGRDEVVEINNKRTATKVRDQTITSNEMNAPATAVVKLSILGFHSVGTQSPSSDTNWCTDSSCKLRRLLCPTSSVAQQPSNKTNRTRIRTSNVKAFIYLWLIPLSPNMASSCCTGPQIQLPKHFKSHGISASALPCTIPYAISQIR